MTDPVSAIVQWTRIEDREPFSHDDRPEPMSYDSRYSDHFGFQRLGIHHIRLEPLRRTSLPHAESAEEEFIYVLSGTPDLWLDGHLHPLAEGDAVGFVPGTGVAHSFLNNTDSAVELLVVGDRPRPENRIVYPLNSERRPLLGDWWADAPVRALGPHDGVPNGQRGIANPDRPKEIIHWRQIEEAEAFVYDGDDEPMCIEAIYSRHFRFLRLGVNHVRLEPGHRTSFPHAESAEEEFVYVIAGMPDVWLDGHLHRLSPGDAVGFPPGTGLAHSFLNNSDSDVELLVVGDRPMDVNRIFYPVNPAQKARRDDWWHDHPQRPLGPHDGLTDAWRSQKG